MVRRKPTQSDGGVPALPKSTLPLRRSARQQQRIKPSELGSSARPVEISDSSEIEPPGDDSQSNPASSKPPSISSLPSKLPIILPGLTKEGRALLEYKQQRLHSRTSPRYSLVRFCNSKSRLWPRLQNAIDSTLIFAQEEAGTAICISSTGLLLTCSHCVAESEEELDKDKTWWLIFASGSIVKAKTVKWDARRDLALLQITASQYLPDYDTLRSPFEFHFISLTETSPRLETKLLCIGQPGSEDLEIGRPGVATQYDILHISDGTFRGYAEGQDIQDNSEIGALMHDCWTYWGHSGAPLVENISGGLVGLHSSWDDVTLMRRGIGWEALRDFLGENLE